MVFKDDKKVELMKENLRGDCLRGDGDKMGSVRKNTVASGNREDNFSTRYNKKDQLTFTRMKRLDLAFTNQPC